MKSIPLIEEDTNAEVPKETEEELENAMKMITIWRFGITLVLIVAWPLLGRPAGVFSKGYFTFWFVLAFIWGLATAIAMDVLPAIEAFSGISALVKGKKDTPAEPVAIPGNSKWIMICV